MLGWHISVYRQTGDNSLPATEDTSIFARLAVWQTGLGGLDWLYDLIDAEKAIDLGGIGYPSKFTAIAGSVIPIILKGPPGANQPWVCGEHDVIGEAWDGKTMIDRAVVAACRENEWLLIEAWDES